ncbi:hypothetical protein C8R46DRAFT_94939 [Mycena filopes]|nr:hypothetical protein C8R46DRAFT_94939 [Mycena filopes]
MGEGRYVRFSSYIIFLHLPFSARFPWWPAVVYADSTPWIPREVLKNALEQRGKVEDFLYIVCFFAEPPSWACVPLDQIRALADSKELDEDMLSFHSRHQRWKSNKNQIRLCRRAYE